MSATVIKGSYLMTPDGLKKDWGVKVENNIIKQVCPNEDLKVQLGDKVIEAKDEMILPGFVNGHNHMYGFLSHGITTESIVTEFSSFLDDFWWPYVEDRIDHELVKATTKWACVEMIESGVTSFADILEGPNSIPNALNIEEEIVRNAGLRGLLSFEACQRVSEENAELGLKENAEFVKKFNKEDNLVQGMMSVHTLFTCDKEYLKKAKKLSDELNCKLHMHLSESVFEPNWCKEKYNKKPVQIYDEIGYLGKNILASQVVQADDSEIETLAKNEVCAVTMPLSNCEVGGGVAPVTKMLEKGMTVGIGTDGYVNNFFEVMRGAFLIHKAHLQDPQVMPAKQVYEMATSMGAKALGFNNTGKLKEGYLADIITVKTDTPTPINEHNVYDQLVLFRNPQDINYVIVNGKILKENGKLTTLDKDKIKENLRALTDKFWNVNNN